VKQIAKIDLPEDEELAEEKVIAEESRRPNSVRFAPERVKL
jgi:hypothetical protein